MDNKQVALRAIIFDCDGVLLDSEPLHFSAFQSVLEEEKFKLTEEEYKQSYLSYDDNGAFTKYFQDHKIPVKIDSLKTYIERKGKIFRDRLQSEGVMPYPAVPELIMAVSQRYPLAVASGSRRDELVLMLEAAGLKAHFETIVSADDVKEGKPNPESYLKAIEQLNNSGKRPTPITPEECVVVEDSKDGILSAHTAGMKCIGVATSYPAFELSSADLVVPELGALRMSQIEDLFHVPAQPAAKPLSHPQSN